MRLCHLSINHIEHGTLSELRGVLEHPVHPSGYATEFRSIGGLRALTGAPFMALSASAPPMVQSDIISSLHLLSPVVTPCACAKG